MNIFYSDENAKLNDEIKNIMQLAADTALEQEFGDEISKLECDIKSMPIDLSVSVVDGEEIKAINSEFRGIDKVTDVLSFPQFGSNEELLEDLMDLADCLKDDDEVLGTMPGDVVLCYDKAVSQAEEYGTGIKRELIYLFVHSIFHLFGYDHMTDEEKLVMRAKEEAVMEVLGL